MADQWVGVLFVTAILIVVVGWLLWLASAVLVLFATFVMGLPTLVSVLLFILFPPSLIAFLVGYVCLQLDLYPGARRNREIE